MKIYTKAGDDGSTGIFGGERISKIDVRIEAIGAVDELNAALGVCASCEPALAANTRAMVQLIQNRLFDLGAELAMPGKEMRGFVGIESKDIHALEEWIDTMESSLECLKCFILPGGSAQAARLHLARTVCRRAERRAIALAQLGSVRNELIQYLNRLSDGLFVAARFENVQAGMPDTNWEKKNQ